MDARSIITAIRDGNTPTSEELTWFAAGLASGAVSDAQAGAFAMAVLLKGLTEPGRVALTRGFTASGQVLKWDLPGPVIDKHSTGGIGDCVSLMLAPALAACGAFVEDAGASWSALYLRTESPRRVQPQSVDNPRCLLHKG